MKKECKKTMKKKCKVSIIMPSLNVDEYIDECIQSVLSQTIAMLEAIVYGLPIILFSDSECADDLNDKKVVCFSVDRSDQSLANTIIEWFENDWDHNYIVQYSKYFSMENVAMNYIDYYKKHISTEI